MKPRSLTRRNVLRGAGVALALPWLESLAPRPARGQTTGVRQRFVAVYFPLGTADFWRPTGTGNGPNWKLSPILEPLAPLKEHVTVLSHVDNTPYGRNPVPATAPLVGSFLTCAKAQAQTLTNGISIDQVVANQLVATNGGKSVTRIDSLQVGLSTINWNTDGLPNPFSRSISWKSPTEPLYKIISPQAVFDRITGGGLPSPMAPSQAALRSAAGKSVLDYVLGNATALKPRLGTSDRARLEQYLSAVRNLELRTQAFQPDPDGCAPLARPTQTYSIGNTPPDYSRDVHADLMVDLIVMALQCDLTRVVSFMLDDGQSDFVYDFLKERQFTASGSSPGTAPVASYGGLVRQSPRSNGYATINWWFVSKLARLCQKLAAINDGNDVSLLRNSLVWFGSETHGGSAPDPRDLPLLFVGRGGDVLTTDQHLDFGPSQSLANVYLTFIRHVFGGADARFGDSTGVVPELM